MANLTNLNNKFLVTTGGNVGINTTSPDSKLDVTGGDITVNTTGTGFMNFKYSSSQKGTIGTDGIDLKITANADLQILPASNVGIGTSSPGRKLTIGNGNGFVNNQISLLDGGGTEQATIAVETTTANDLLIASKANLRFFTASTIGNTTTLPTNERMRIDSSGNVSLNGGLLGLGNAASTPNIGYGMFHYSGVGLGIYSSASGATQGIGFWLNNGSAYEAGRFLSNGNLGIGTTSPNFKLDIVNAAASTATYQQFRNGTTGTGSGDGTVMGIDADGDFLINNQEAKEIKLYTSDTQRLTIQSGGNVGIGETSPLGKLHIKATDTASTANSVGNLLVLEDSENGMSILSSTSGAGYILFGDSGDNDIGGILYDHSANDMRFRTNGVWDRLRIDSSGDVGIGTAPETAGPTWRTLFVGASLAFLSRQSAAGSDSVVANNYYINSSNADVKRVTGTSSRMFLDGDVIRFQNSGSGAADSAVSWNERMRIAANGNVGIGTTSPVAKFEVTDGSSSITLQEYNNGAAIFLDGVNGDFIGGDYFHILADGNSYLGLGGVGGGTTPLNITNAGNVAIGATSSSSKLKVEGPNTPSNPLVDLVASGTGSFQRGVRLLNGGMNSGDEIMYCVGRSDNTRNMGQMYFHYVGNGSTSNRLSMGLHGVDDVFNIAGTGNVGIGTTAPRAKLEVNGELIAEDIKHSNYSVASLNTTGVTVATITGAGNGSSAQIEFIGMGGTSGIVDVVYSCTNQAGNWYAYKKARQTPTIVDVDVSGHGTTTLTFTFKALSGSAAYTPRLMMKGSPAALVTF